MSVNPVATVAVSLIDTYIERGGPRSGHWGHRGRKGKRGGSAPGPGRSNSVAFFMGATGIGETEFPDHTRKTLREMGENVPAEHVEGLRSLGLGADETTRELGCFGYYDPSKRKIQCITDNKQVLAHELGHHVGETIVGRSNMKEVAGDWRKALTRDERVLRDEYGLRKGVFSKSGRNRSPDEFFAESYALWARGHRTPSKTIAGRTFGEMMDSYRADFPETSTLLDDLFT